MIIFTLESSERMKLALQTITPKIVEVLNIDQILPSLYSHKILTTKEYKMFQDEHTSRHNKAQKIVTLLSEKECANALNGFVKSLRETAEGTSHDKLAELLLSTCKTVTVEKPQSLTCKILG